MTSGGSALCGVRGMHMKWRLWTTTKGQESTMAKKLKPVHPGEILRDEFMKPLGLSMNRMAMDLRVPGTRIPAIVNQRGGPTGGPARRFSMFFENCAVSFGDISL